MREKEYSFIRKKGLFPRVGLFSGHYSTIGMSTHVILSNKHKVDIWETVHDKNILRPFLLKSIQV